MQNILDTIHSWYEKWQLVETKIMHCLKQICNQPTNFPHWTLNSFRCKSYRYLGYEACEIVGFTEGVAIKATE